MSNENSKLDAERAVETFVAELTKLGKCVISIDDLNALIADRAALQQARSLPEGAPEWPAYHDVAMGCGLEDRGITDRYEAMRHGWDDAVERCAEAFNNWLAAAPTVKAEQVRYSAEDLQKEALDAGLQYVRESDDHYVTGTTEQALDFIRNMIGVDIRLTDKAPSLPAAGSAELITEAERCLFVLREIGSMDADDITGCDVSIVDYAEKSAYVLERLIAALSAQQSAPERVSGQETARLDFMLQKSRKVVCERLPHDNFEVYVEEGFMGDVRYPAVRYSGEWEQGETYALEIQREAIDAALLASHAEGGKV